MKRSTLKNITRTLSSAFLVLLLVSGSLVLTPPKKAEAAAQGDGKFIYGESTVTTPRTRNWTGTLGVEGDTIVAAATIRHVIVKASPVRDEMIAGIQTTGGTLYIQRWNGTAWSNEWNVAVGDGNLPRFDITFESSSGDMLVVYTGNVATDGQELKYRIWNGSTWTAATNLGSTRTTGIIDAVAMERRGGTDEIALVYGDRNFDLSANYWDGATNAWKGEPAAALEVSLAKVGTATTLTNFSFDLEFESTSGDLLIVWGADAVLDGKYVTRGAGPAGAWGTVTTNTAFLEEPTDVELSADPNSDYIAYANSSDNGGDSDAIVWTGTAWGTAFQVDATNDTVGAGTSNNAVNWVTSGAETRAILTYDDANAAGVDWAVYNKNTNAWAVQTDCTTACSSQPAGLDDTMHRLRRNPFNQAELLLLVIDGNSDLFVKKLTFDGTNLTWSNADEGVALEATISSITGYSADFAFNRYVPAVTTLGDGTDPSNSTIAPGAAATEIDRFSFVSSAGTDTVTGLTVTLGPADAFNNIATVDVQTTAGVSKCSATPSSNTVSLTGCAIAVTTSSTEYKIMITPKSHASMAAPATGASYATVATVTTFTSTNAQAGTDTDSAIITVDNLSPANVTSATVTAGDGQNSLSWTNPVDADFDEVVILRNTSVVSDTPVEGTNYATSTAIGTSIVVCEGNMTSCINSGTNGTAYHYKIFAKDVRGNYSATGVVPTGSPATPQVTITVSSIGSQNSIISIPTADKFVGGAFRLQGSSGATNVTSIGITVNDSTGLSGVQLYTDTATSCSTADPTTATLFNSTPGTFSSNKATVTGTLSVTTAFHCIYVVLDVESSAVDNQNLEVTINANSDITVSAGQVSGSPVGISGGTFLRKPTLDQVGYRFFENTNSTSVDTPIGVPNSAQSLTTSNQAFRLRALLRVGVADLSTNGATLKLQYSAKLALCDTGAWSDVTTATPIAFNDNTTPADGAALTANATLDPTDGASVIVNQTYEESNNFTNSQALIGVSQTGKWDFSLKDNGAPASTAYCLRVVKSDGTILTYTNYPEITTAAAGTPDIQQLHYRWREDNGSESSATYATAEDTALTSGVYVGDRRRLRLSVSNGGTASASNVTYRLEHASSSCSAWLPVPSISLLGNQHWVMDYSNYINDGVATTDLAGLTNPGGKSFVAGFAKTQGNEGSSHTLSTSQFTELEYSIKSTSNAVTGTTYCFRLTNAGSITNFSYLQQPQILLSAVVNRPAGGGGGGNSGAGGESTGSGTIQGGGVQGGGATTTPGGDGSGSGTPQGGGGSGGGGGDTGFLRGTTNLAQLLHNFLMLISKLSQN